MEKYNIFVIFVLIIFYDCFSIPTCPLWRPRIQFHVRPTYTLSSLALKKVLCLNMWPQGQIRWRGPYGCIDYIMQFGELGVVPGVTPEHKALESMESKKTILCYVICDWSFCTVKNFNIKIFFFQLRWNRDCL